MMKRWHLMLVSMGLVLALSSGCKKQSNKAASSLLQFVPRDNHGVLLLHRMGDVPKQLDALLSQYEGPTGQFRAYIKGTQGRIGLDPLAVKDLKANGLDPAGGMVISRVKVNGRRHGVMALSITSSSTFEKWLRKNLALRMVAKTFVPTTKDGNAITTAYRVDKSKQAKELIAYTLRKRQAVLVWSFEDSKGSKDKTAHNADALGVLLAQKSEDSIQTDKAFHKALMGSGSTSQALFYMPPSTEKVDAKTAKLRVVEMKRRLNQLKERFPLLGRLPASQLQVLAKANPLDGVLSSLKFGKTGIHVRTLVPIPAMVMAPVRSAVPTGGSASNLLKALHKDAILTIKTGVEPAMLPMFVQQIAAGMKQDPAKLLGLFKQFTGLVLEKDIIPAATGHVMITLYRINMKPLQQVIGGNVFAIFQMLDLALVAEGKDAKKMANTLKILAASFKNGPNKVESTKQKDGRILYSIVAWPNTKAYWTAYKNYFIYALNEAAIQRTIDAIDNPKARAYPDPSKAGILAANQSSALSLDLGNLRSLLGELPFVYRLVVSNAIATYNLDKLQALTLSYQPDKAHAILQADLQLKAK